MLRYASLLSSDTSLLGSDPVRPTVAHLTSLHLAGQDSVIVTLPSSLVGLRPDDDYLLDVESYRTCFDQAHDHSAALTDDSQFYADLPGPRSTISQLDGNNDDDDDNDDDDEEPEKKRQKRMARSSRQSMLKIRLQWSFDRPPQRTLASATTADELTPAKLILLLNQKTDSIFNDEFLALAWREPPYFYLIPESSRVVACLPPLSVVHLANFGHLLWNFLGFANLGIANSPFRECPNGDFALANFSPTKTRMFVADYSVAPNHTLSASDSTKDSTYWIEVNKKLSSEGSVILHRLLEDSTFEVDLSKETALSDPSLSGASATPRPPPPPLLASSNLETLLNVACEGFGLQKVVVRRSVASNGEFLAEEEEKDARFNIRDDIFPRLGISPLYAGMPAGRLKLTMTAGNKAALLLGFLPTETALISFDAAVGFESRGNAFLRGAGSYNDWNTSTDGDPIKATQHGQLVLTMGVTDVTQPTASAKRTQNGLLAKARKTIYSSLTATEDFDVRMYPQQLLDKATASSDADFEEEKSSYLNLAKDSSNRSWRGALIRSPETLQLLPVVPDLWKQKVLPPSPATADVSDQEQQQQQQQTDASEAEQPAQESDKTETTASDDLVVVAAEEVPAEAEENDATDPNAEEELQEVSGSSSEAKPSSDLVDVAEAEEEREESEAVPKLAEKYHCVLAGTTDRRSSGICPIGDTTKLPDTFYLTVDEGERSDLLGPLGLCSYAGTFKGSDGQRVRSREVILRGGGQLTRLTFRIVTTAYSAFVPTKDGVAFLTCRLRPYRARELPVALSAAAAAAAAAISARF